MCSLKESVKKIEGELACYEDNKTAVPTLNQSEEEAKAFTLKQSEEDAKALALKEELKIVREMLVVPLRCEALLQTRVIPLHVPFRLKFPKKCDEEIDFLLAKMVREGPSIDEVLFLDNDTVGNAVCYECPNNFKNKLLIVFGSNYSRWPRFISKQFKKTVLSTRTIFVDCKTTKEIADLNLIYYAAYLHAMLDIHVKFAIISNNMDFEIQAMMFSRMNRNTIVITDSSGIPLTLAGIEAHMSKVQPNI